MMRAAPRARGHGAARRVGPPPANTQQGESAGKKKAREGERVSDTGQLKFWKQSRYALGAQRAQQRVERVSVDVCAGERVGEAEREASVA
eukprot:1754175-Pleurochrysis_carterae.AAC.2